MRDTLLPKAMSNKAKQLKEKLPDEEFVKLQRFILETYAERKDPEQLTQRCIEWYRILLNNN